MRRVLLDTSAVNWIADNPGSFEAGRAAADRGDLEILYTHDVEDEISQTAELARREQLAAILRLGRKIRTAAFAADYSRLDEAALAGPDDILAIDAMRSGGNIRYTRDALISLTALQEGCALVTNEKSHQPNRAREQGVEVLNMEQFAVEIGFVLPVADSPAAAYLPGIAEPPAE